MQQSRLAYSIDEKDPEIEGEIPLRKIFEIVTEKEKTKFRLSSRERQFVFEASDEKTAEAWVAQIKITWKAAVSAITENPPSPDSAKNQVC